MIHSEVSARWKLEGKGNVSACLVAVRGCDVVFSSFLPEGEEGGKLVVRLEILFLWEFVLTFIHFKERDLPTCCQTENKSSRGSGGCDMIP